jgi:hypothetical protein
MKDDGALEGEAGSAAEGAAARRVTLVSFDIDGTLEVGDPPGVVPVALVRQARSLGYLIGSCSDRPLGYQHTFWERLQIAPDFTVLKHRLADVRARFAAAVYYHIGDTDVDEVYATAAGFRFLRADPAAHRAWSPALFARPSDGGLLP